MKILYFSHVFGSVTTTFIYNEVVAFNKEPGFSVHYLSLTRENVDTKPFNNITVIPFKRNKIINKVKWILEKRNIHLSFYNKKFKIAAKKLISKIQPDIIHCHFGYEALYLLNNTYSEKNKYIIQFHGYDASKKLNSKVYIKALRKYGAKPNIQFITVSEFMKDQLGFFGIHPVNPIEVLYCGIDTEFFKNSSISQKPSKEVIFLQVSSLVPKKGHTYTIDAFKLFKERNPQIKVKLIIAGKDFMKGVVQQYASTKLGPEDILFTGAVNASQIIALMKEANFFVHHSIMDSEGDQEGIPNTIMEAMSMNLPVISTFHSGIPELVENKKTGLLVKEKDIAAYASAMEDLVKGKYKFQPRETIENKFSFNIHLQNLKTIYQKLYNGI